MGSLKKKLPELLNKYKYAVLILIVGIVLLLLPGKQTKADNKAVVTEKQAIQSDLDIQLESILSAIEGAGRVEVMLTVSKGQQTYYQYDMDQSNSDNSVNTKSATVIITDSSKNESGMVTRVDPAKYQGAVVLCEGAESSEIRLAIIDAVSKVTGLGADKICVLKMK